MASKARLFGDNLTLSAIPAPDDSREQKRLGRHVRHFNRDLWQQEGKHLVLRSNLPNFSQNENMLLAFVHTGQHRLAEASPYDKLWGNGLSACDPESINSSTVKCATLTTTSGKKISNVSSREATLQHSHKKTRYPLPLATLANAASLKPAHVIIFGAPACALARPLILGFRALARNPS